MVIFVWAIARSPDTSQVKPERVWRMFTPDSKPLRLTAMNSRAGPWNQVAVIHPSRCHTVANRSQSPESRHRTQFSTVSRIASLSAVRSLGIVALRLAGRDSYTGIRPRSLTVLQDVLDRPVDRLADLVRRVEELHPDARMLADPGRIFLRDAVDDDALGLDRNFVPRQAEADGDDRFQLHRLLGLDEDAAGADVLRVLEDEFLVRAESHLEAGRVAGEGAERTGKTTGARCGLTPLLHQSPRASVEGGRVAGGAPGAHLTRRNGRAGCPRPARHTPFPPPAASPRGGPSPRSPPPGSRRSGSPPPSRTHARGRNGSSPPRAAPGRRGGWSTPSPRPLQP